MFLVLIPILTKKEEDIVDVSHEKKPRWVASGPLYLIQYEKVLFDFDFNDIIFLRNRGGGFWVGRNLFQFHQMTEGSKRRGKRRVIFRVVRQGFYKRFAVHFHLELGNYPARPNALNIGWATAVLRDFEEGDFHAVRIKFGSLVDLQREYFIEFDGLAIRVAVFIASNKKGCDNSDRKNDFFHVNGF